MNRKRDDRPTILCVDDEKIVLDSLRLQLKGLFDKNCIIETAESGEEALEIIEEIIEETGRPPQLIISDQIMPKMKGHELLSIVTKNHPKIMKILLTGLANKDDIINAINDAQIYRYISKPWEKDDLNLTVKEAVNSYYRDREIEQKNEELQELNKSLEQKVIDRTKELELQQKKSNELLLNILPKKVAEELIEKGYAQPKHYDSVSVLFSDFKGFTSLSKDMDPETLINDLNKCFSAFDEIMIKYNIEKIKTLGDGYMAAGGIPIPNHTNALDTVRAGLEMIQYIEDLKKEWTAAGKPTWEIRVGIHTGSLIAGVVGSSKFAYDIWGDTVNTASRLESSCEPGKLNVSIDTYQLIKDHFNCTARGKIEIKNRGKIDMYFVDSMK